MHPVFGDVFTELAVLLLLAAVIGTIGVRLRHPLIVAFIAVGNLVGPSVLGWVPGEDQVDLLAKLGIALLLFVVGLELAAIGAQVVPAILLSLFVLLGNPLIVMIILGIMGYGKRTGFLAGLTVAQIREFSLIWVPWA